MTVTGGADDILLFPGKRDGRGRRTRRGRVTGGTKGALARHDEAGQGYHGIGGWVPFKRRVTGDYNN